MKDRVVSATQESQYLSTKNVTDESKGNRSLLSKLAEAVARYLLLASLVLIALGIFLIAWGFEQRQNSLLHFFASEIGKAIIITGLVTGGTKWYLTRQYTELIRTGQKVYEEEHKQELQSTLSRVEDRILHQTQTIASYASSLDAMQKADIVRLYESRNAASLDIKADLEDRGISTVRIIGISLNDFLRPGSGAFHQAWRTIEHYITGGQSIGHPLNVKVLLIDPTCHGAYHRSKAEETGRAGIAGRLENDVLDSIEALKRLERQAANECEKGVQFQVRLYRTPPILYLVQTDFVSYVQQYHFWPHYDPNLNIPVIRYQGRSSSVTQGRSMHDEMRFHFDYIWENCSVGIREYLDEAARGSDEAIREANISNIYYDKEMCKKRIIHLMDAAQNRIYIKGVTLYSFFRDGELFDSFCRAVTRGGIEVKVLLIDPESEQAKIRSFREYLLRNPGGDWRDFCSRELHREQVLYLHAQQSINNLRGFLRELKEQGVQHNIAVKIFSSAPECFMLMTDHSVMVEQYHYGKIRPAVGKMAAQMQSRILGGDVPVIEYVKLGSKEPRASLLRDVYRIFEDHFNFVFRNFAKDIMSN